MENPIDLQSMGITAITFDLDDTLWPCAPVITAAEQTYYDWISQRFPQLADKHSLSDIIDLRRSMLALRPELKNDVTVLRQIATAELLEPYGATEADVNEAVRVCVEARQKVTFYDEVLTALQELSFHYRLGSITNGNADLSAIGVTHIFDIELAATLQLPAKPAPDMFIAAFEALGVSSERVLHVGDHPFNDVTAAKELGCRTAWITRYDDTYPDDLEPADLNITDLNALVQLAPVIAR